MSTITVEAKNEVATDWEPKHYGAPIIMASYADMGEPLGPPLNGKLWYAYDGSEWEPSELFAESSPWAPNGPLVREMVDGDKYVRSFVPHRPGSYDARSNPAPRPAPAPKPFAPIDALGSGVLNRTGAAAFGPGRPALRVRGAAAILERLEAKGTRVVLNASRDGLVMLSSGGRPPAFHVSTVQAAAPILVPYLRDGVPPSCQVTPHDAEAVTVAEPGTPWCGTCGECVP